MKRPNVTIMECDVPNKNGRIYTKAEVENAVTKREVMGTPLLGCVGMPDGALLGIDLFRVSHKVENLRVEGNFLKGDITVLQTPHGKILEGLIDHVEFRCAGLGTFEEDPHTGVRTIKDWTLVSVNAVTPDTAA